jgi:hypothetical protein
MAAYNKHYSFLGDVFLGRINLTSDTLRCLLTNTAPVAGDIQVDTTTTPCTIKATSNAVETAAGNGYTKKGIALTVTTSTYATTTYTLAANQIVWTAAGGAMAAFRYVDLYDDTALTTATRPVISWWDYGSSITLNDTETFTVQFNSTNPGTIFTCT